MDDSMGEMEPRSWEFDNQQPEEEDNDEIILSHDCAGIKSF